MTTNLIWRDDVGWDVIRGGDRRHVPIDAAFFAAAPRYLESQASERYRQLANSPNYLSWWADACGGEAPGIRRFAVHTPAVHWERPWEATIASLGEARWSDVAMVRLVLGEAKGVAPQEIGAPLRTMLLQGQEVAEGLQGLDLVAERTALEHARAQLDAAVQALVSPIETRQIGQADLVAALIEVKPTILWLSGHATADPPGFLLVDGHWLSPDDLAAAVKEAAQASGRVPLYVVLWACKTGLNPRFAAPRAAPPFVAALASVGVSAVLATLAPLADDIAPDFAAEVFTAIAAGRPLDHAVARARAKLMASQLPAGERYDWACPVTWCVDAPSDEIEWSDAAASAQRQSLARRLVVDPLETAELDGAGVAQTGLWAQYRRIWVVNRSASSFQVRSEWLVRVLGLQSVTSQMVLTFDFRDGTGRNVIRDWAKRLMRQTDGFDDPDRRLRKLAFVLSEDPESGWHALCDHETMTLALIEPAEKEPWLWKSLRDGKASAIVLAKTFPAEMAAYNWKVEQLADPAPLAGFDPLQHPIAPALAILAYPAAESDLAAIDATQVEALKQNGFLVQTRAGCVMPLSRAMSLVDEFGPDQLIAAHRSAFAMLDGMAARAKLDEGASETLLKARLHHAKAGGDPAALSTSAQQLMKRYRDERRASALLDVFTQADPRDIDEAWKVSAGWAHLSVGSPTDAMDWLDLAQDDELDPVVQANKRELIAEVEKSSGAAGSKERARSALDEALALLDGAPDDVAKPTRLRIQHDLARLTHFIDGDPCAAIPQYEAVYASWVTLPHSGLDQAITLRNLAEARMMLAGRGGDDALFDAASDDLSRARDSLPPNTGHTVAAELEYVAGRLALRRRDKEAATAFFQQARSVGLATNHLMLVAIAEARLFWWHIEGQPAAEYDAAPWAARVAALTPFQGHAWTARVMIDGHLRSARYLLDGGLKRPAAAALSAAMALLDANPAFDAGSDRARIIATYAGLLLTGGDQAAWDAMLIRFDWAAQWIVDHNAAAPEKAWEATR
ncbi:MULTISPECIES: CHAT domain-containing protein [Gluconobacter]|uniref:CHAT domain-containing protein n=1 Tax=Gluconobacter cadivus TaxID=2728101 RepID=A0ABR9Z015_9PROT|nr:MULTISPECIES: CHAT domain-containing protein [Gluconobacter]MBF0889761.1 CHAT domain-containing protein [Gluconobacter cadivus]MBS1061342.1 CHAT domain-containing protein [Gluconobacter sp. Dm-44]